MTFKERVYQNFWFNKKNYKTGKITYKIYCMRNTDLQHCLKWINKCETI